MDKITIGFPRMHKEPGERRDFLPPFISRLNRWGAQVVLEHEYGSGMGFTEADYQKTGSHIRFARRQEVYRQDYVVVLRCPDDEEIRWMRPGACLISMLHYPTRPERVEFLRAGGLEAISLDSIKDDVGRRLIENLKAVAWNGVEAAFRLLQQIYPAPGFESPDRPPVHVTLLGAGQVGIQVVNAAIRYGDDALRKRLAQAGVPGVQVTAVDYDLSCHAGRMQALLERTDILVDATQRPDPTQPVILNEWVAGMPEHAVLLDLSVDPYNCQNQPAYVKGIEGIPQGNLDQYIFAPGDPAYETLPACVRARHRRYVVSCYSWPGIYPQQCMKVYGAQLQPILRVLLQKGGYQSILPEGNFFERAIGRALISRWQNNR